MRKIIGIAVLFCLLCTTPVFAFDDLVSSEAETAIRTLSALEIVEGCDEDSFCPQNPVTRAEFTAMLIRALGIDASAWTGDASNFLDVGTDHWAAGDVAFGVSAGFVSGYGDGTFRPDDNITYSEIIKLLVSVVGYGPMAEENGGYPNGYLATAGQVGILKRVTFSSEEAATREMAAQLLYQAMQVEVVEPVYGQQASYQLTGETLMDRLLEHKNLSSIIGVVTQTAQTGLKGESQLANDRVCIDDVVYAKGAVDADAFFGMRVEAYVYQVNENDIPVIVSIIPLDNQVLELQADDLAEVDLNRGVIEYGDRDKERISSDLSVIYNGRAVENVTEEDLQIVNGAMTLLDNSKDDVYDVIFIEESFSVVVDKVSEATQMIFLKSGTIGGLPRINLDEDQDDFSFSIHDRDGNALGLSDLSEDDILTVKADKSLLSIDITAHTEKISGAITEYSPDENELVIDGKTYRIGKDEQGALMVTPDLQQSGFYYADANEEIVYFEEGELILQDLGLVQGIAATNALLGGFKVRLLTGGIIESFVDESDDKPYAEVGNGSWSVYEAADKIRFDGRSVAAEQVLEQIQIGDLIQYSVNSEGKINAIEKWMPDVELTADSYNPEIQSFGGEFYVDDSTAIFCMPTNDAADEDYFTKITLDSGIEYDLSGYEIDEETQVAKAAVIRQEMIADQPGKVSNAKDIVLVNKLISRLEGDGQVLVLNGYMDGKEINETINDESGVYSIAKSLKFGDVIYISKNSLGYVDNIEFVESLNPAPAYFHKDQRLQNERMFGKLHTVKRNRLDKTSNRQMSAFTINLGESEDADQELVETRVQTNQMPPIYMIDSRFEEIRVVTIDDVYATEEVGYSGASDLFLCKKKYDVTGIVILK